MQWELKSRYCQISTDGYVVSAFKVRGEWTFEAWGPMEKPELSYWQWLDLVGKAHYARGERVPQRRKLLGRAATAEEARQLCEQAA